MQIINSMRFYLEREVLILENWPIKLKLLSPSHQDPESHYLNVKNL